MSPPPAHSTSPKGDDEVVSQRAFPGQGEALEIIRAASKDNSSAVGHTGEEAPMRTDGGGQVASDLSRISFRRPARLRCQASGLPRKEGVCLFRW